jgi:ABC-type polysaccharide/polyol phosphate export permease
VLANLFDFVVASCVLTVILACVGVPISLNLLWVPPIVALLILLTAGLAIFLSAAGLFFRDVKYLVEIFVMFAIFVTPVFFSASILGRWEWVLLMNPVAPLLEGMSDAVVLGQMPNLAWLGYSMVAAVGIFGGAVAIFRRLESIFAECI